MFGFGFAEFLILFILVCVVARNKCRRSALAVLATFAMVVAVSFGAFVVALVGYRWQATQDAHEAERHAEEARRDIERMAQAQAREGRGPAASRKRQKDAELNADAKQPSAEQRQAAIQLAQAQNHVAAAIDSADIYDLMDQFDAPRIYLPPISPIGPISIVSPFQLMKQIAGSASGAPAIPIVPNAPAPPAPPEFPVAATAVVEAESAAPDAKSDAQAAVATFSDLEPVVTVPSKPVALSQAESTAPAPPKWIHAPSETVNGRWSRVLVAGDFVTEDECQAETNKKLHEATNEFIRQFAAGSSPQIDLQDPLASMGLGTSYLRDQIAKGQYFETVERSVGPMKKLYTRMEINPDVQRDLQDRWQTYERQFRFGLVGMWSGGILGIIGLAWGLLRIDTATKGYYTKRLFLGVPAAIIGVSTLLWVDPFQMF